MQSQLRVELDELIVAAEALPLARQKENSWRILAEQVVGELSAVRRRCVAWPGGWGGGGGDAIRCGKAASFPTPVETFTPAKVEALWELWRSGMSAPSCSNFSD